MHLEQTNPCHNWKVLQFVCMCVMTFQAAIAATFVRPTAGMALKPNHNHVDGGGMSLTSVVEGFTP